MARTQSPDCRKDAVGAPKAGLPEPEVPACLRRGPKGGAGAEGE